MSLIERAARRLDELQRAGIELPRTGSSGLDQSVGDTEAVEPIPAVASAQRPVEGRGGTAAARSKPVSDWAPRRSKDVAVDIARLAAQGYLTPGSPRGVLADEFRILKRPVLDNAHGKGAAPIRRANLIMVTSAVPGEGKTFTAINLALSIAMEVDSTVLLVDADVERPAVLDRLGLPSSPGLLDLLTQPELEVADVLLRTDVERLAVLPAGTPHPRATELLASAGLSRLLDEMATRYPDRILVFDAPPLLLSTEARALAAQVGQVLMVVEAERTTHATVTSALGLIESCPVVMTVLNKAESSQAGGYYGQYGDYGA